MTWLREHVLDWLPMALGVSAIVVWSGNTSNAEARPKTCATEWQFKCVMIEVNRDMCSAYAWRQVDVCQ